MHGSSSLIEAPRINQEPCSFLRHQQPVLRETQIIAYTHSEAAELSIKDAHFISRTECFRFDVSDFSRNVDVEKVDLAILFLKLSLWVDHKGSIEQFFVSSSGDGANCVHFMLNTGFLDGFEGWRI